MEMIDYITLAVILIAEIIALKKMKKKMIEEDMQKDIWLLIIAATIIFIVIPLGAIFLGLITILLYMIYGNIIYALFIVLILGILYLVK